MHDCTSMSVKILNRDFQHPPDGWYQIECKGEHPNARAGVLQIIDDTACQSIVNRFNVEADKAGFAGMLIDHEHFKHDEDKETTAYGWLMRLQNRADGIYGQIRWTGTGEQAVDNGDYRFFSTEYDSRDLEVIKNGKPKLVRPLRLDGLTLTNMNNNKGQKPITNRTIQVSETASPLALEAARAAKADKASSEANDDPATHDVAVELHRKAADAYDKLGHTGLASDHLMMAASHEKAAGRRRNGVQEEAPGTAQEHAEAAASTENRRHAADSEPEYVSDEQRILNSARARDLTEEMMFDTKKDRTACWLEVRLRNPELFLPSESEVRNRQVNEEREPEAIDQSAISANLRIEATRLSRQTGQPFAECWSDLMRADPSTVPVLNSSRNAAPGARIDITPGMTLSYALFLCQTGQSRQSQAEAIRIVNSPPRRAIIDKPLDSLELDAAIQDFRVKNRCGSYDEARRGLRERNPGYFIPVAA
jgi:Mu-like prophage I protein